MGPQWDQSQYNKQNTPYLGRNCCGMIIIDFILSRVQAVVMHTIHRKLARKGANKFSKLVEN